MLLVTRLFPKTWKDNKNMFGFHTNSLKLKVQPCKLYNNKYMMASKQRTTTAVFAFITVLVFKLLSRKVFFMDRKAESCRFKYAWPFCYQLALKGWKVDYFIRKLLKNYKQLESKIFRILLKHASVYLSVLFNLHDCTFKPNGATDRGIPWLIKKVSKISLNISGILEST